MVLRLLLLPLSSRLHLRALISILRLTGRLVSGGTPSDYDSAVSQGQVAGLTSMDYMGWMGAVMGYIGI